MKWCFSAAPTWIGISSKRVTTSPQCIHSETASILQRWTKPRSPNGINGHGTKPASARSCSRAVAEIIAQPVSGRPNKQV